MHEVVSSTSAAPVSAGEQLGGPPREGAAGRRVAAADALPGRSRARAPRPTATLKGMSGSSAAGPSSSSCACATAGTSLSSFVSSRVTTAAASPSWSASRALLSSKYPSSVLRHACIEDGCDARRRVDHLAVGDRRTARVEPEVRHQPGQHRGVGQQLLGEEHVRGRGERRGPGLEVLGVAATAQVGEGRHRRALRVPLPVVVEVGEQGVLEVAGLQAVGGAEPPVATRRGARGRAAARPPRARRASPPRGPGPAGPRGSWCSCRRAAPRRGRARTTCGGRTPRRGRRAPRRRRPWAREATVGPS